MNSRCYGDTGWRPNANAKFSGAQARKGCVLHWSGQRVWSRREAGTPEKYSEGNIGRAPGRRARG